MRNLQNTIRGSTPAASKNAIEQVESLINYNILIDECFVLCLNLLGDLSFEYYVGF